MWGFRSAHKQGFEQGVNEVAKTSSVAKSKKKPKFAHDMGNGVFKSVRQHNRCHICGRPRAFLRKFKICRLCFRSLALQGEIPGVKKSSW
jgi:small subunit ribosomal protein S14